MRRTLLAAFIGLTECALNPLMPDPRTVSDRAREIAPRCTHIPKEVDAEVLSASIIDEVTPWIDHVQSGNDRVARLRGARLRVRARPDLSAEVLELSLECHQARVALGTANELEQDPYAFAGRWLDIKTHSADDSFVVSVRVDDIATARAVLARARQFATSRP